MKLTLSLINPPWDDTAIFVERENTSAAWLLDCGNLARLRVRDLMRIEKVFISHTHIDHFCGLDYLMRMNLREDKNLDIYGPPGLTTQLGHKLLGYAWDYDESAKFSITAHEISADSIASTLFLCSEGFQPKPQGIIPHDSTLKLPGGVTMRFTCAVHRPHAPCLSYLLEEPRCWRFDNRALAALGLKNGPWIGQLKKMLDSGENQGKLLVDGSELSAEELASRCFTSVPGRRLAFITDSIFNKASVKNFKSLGIGLDELWCEACYRHSQLDLARQYCHFTAKQAGRLAAELEAKALFIFHYSRRYTDELMGHIEEAREVFPATQLPRIYENR